MDQVGRRRGRGEGERRGEEGEEGEESRGKKGGKERREKIGEKGEEEDFSSPPESKEYIS
jgi:hypothetical protein